VTAVRRLLHSAILLALGSAAWADDPLPDDCTQHLTVQTRDCSVDHHYTCASAPGDHFLIVYGDSGRAFYAHNNAETQWISSQSLPDGARHSTIMPPSDPVSISTLLSDGYDSYIFDQQIDAENVVRYEGFDRLTGETTEIDGETLLRTSFRYRVTLPRTGALLRVVQGQQYVSETHRVFFGGVDTYQSTEGEVSVDSTPVEFFYPGEAGFLSTTPMFGCTGMMSALQLPEDHA